MKCNKCNQTINKNDKFCSHCGSEINKKKTISIIIISTLIIIALAIFIFMPKIDHSNYVSLINANWELDLPYCDEEIYYTDDGSVSPFGDGDRYSILKYTNQDKIKQLNNIQWDNTIETEDIQTANSILQSCSVPSSKRINLDENLLYMIIRDNHTSEELIIAYDKNSQQLYIFERFI